MSVKLLTEDIVEFLILKGICTDSFESTLVEMPNCMKSHVMAQMWLVHIQLFAPVYSPVVFCISFCHQPTTGQCMH